mgnify:CR=1 FL=1|jgi:hypothetical protein
MNPSELLTRLSQTLRTDIAPAVGEEYPRTQAFMASVILERLAKHVALADAHGRAEADDLDVLTSDLRPLLRDAPLAVTETLDTVVGIDSLGPVIEALYRWKAAGREGSAMDGTEIADQALAMIRPALRRDIDRRMEIAT